MDQLLPARVRKLGSVMYLLQFRHSSSLTKVWLLSSSFFSLRQIQFNESRGATLNFHKGGPDD